MGHLITRRDALRTMAAAGCLAAVPAALPPAPAGGHAEDASAGWVSGNLTGAEALVLTLQLEGTGCVYGIPGAQENEVWDTMKSKGLPYLLCTHEFSAACMADGYARATGRPGVLAVVPGPGVTNSASGLGEALLDSVPVVCIACDVARGDKYRPFQVHELPNVGLLQQVTKAVFAVEHVGQIPTAVRQAFALSRAGEPGPVAVVIPYNLFIVKHDFHCPPLAPPGVPFDDNAFACALQLLANRKCRIGIYAGMGCMDFGQGLTLVAEMLQAPVATSVSGKGCINECHPLAVGWGYGTYGTRAAENAFKEVDVVLAIGVRYSEVSTAFYAIPKDHGVIHVDANPNNLGRAVKAKVCVNADAGVFLARLLQHRDLLQRPANPKLIADIAAWKKDDCKHNCEMYGRCGADPMALILALRRCTNEDALLFVDVTQSEHWAAEAFTVCRPRTYFNPTDNQAMGWSIPASIGAQRVFPGRQVATITGDGCFLMTAMEISTAARECLPVKFFVLDDQAYHYMQTLQKSAYLRTTATILARLDYAALARGFGVAYNEISCTEEVEAGVRHALCQPGPVLTRVVTDYGKRPMRWIDTVKRRYRDELCTQQKVRFLARMGSRAVHFHKEND
ncbi:MAG TPA: thiamine pyrophosphate-binding protein [Gemmataceae bacterium]|nr:thiamine pyrophosphate-binding protein [Gemmataceae bacterium]